MPLRSDTHNVLPCMATSSSGGSQGPSEQAATRPVDPARPVRAAGGPVPQGDVQLGHAGGGGRRQRRPGHGSHDGKDDGQTSTRGHALRMWWHEGVSSKWRMLACPPDCVSQSVRVFLCVSCPLVDEPVLQQRFAGRAVQDDARKAQARTGPQGQVTPTRHKSSYIHIHYGVVCVSVGARPAGVRHIRTLQGPA